MDELLNQLAKTLKIPTDALQQAVNHYPELRQQFVIYKSLTYVENTLDIIGAVAFIVFACAWTLENDCGIDYKKRRRSSIIVTIVALTIATIIHVVTIMTTSDIQVIMEVIKK